MIPTGLEKLDSSLHGGIPPGIIADIFGASGTGKTQFLMQLSANAIRDRGRVLYVDTTGSFRPERVLELAGRSGPDPGILRNISVSRVTNTSEQIRVLDGPDPKDLALVAIDNITDLFSFEYGRDEQAPEKNRMFMRYMRSLSRFGMANRIPIVVTNMIRAMGDREVENMGGAIDRFTHVKIRLSGTPPTYSGRVLWAGHDASFSYGIGASGLADPTEDI